MEKKPVPVILDTDIGGDIDDSWALALLLRCPELDPKLVVTALEGGDDPIARAKIAAKQIAKSGRCDIPVGAGLCVEDESCTMGGWADDYDISTYPAPIYRDGVQAMIDTVMNSPEPVTIICIAPLTNVAEALRREPRIADNARIIAIMGSIYNGHSLDVIQKASDYNVRADIPSAREVFAAPWDITIAPLDITAHLVVGDDNYQHILAKRESDPVCNTVLSAFDRWMEVHNCTYYKTHTTSLYDTAAIYIAVTDDYNVIMEDHLLSIDDGGYTNDDPAGRPVRCAVYWKYKDVFYKFVTDRLCGR
ncbi:MAG: nucleoside hydrolase [Ruminococcaceae bacterium]|nr:nucleoside hydrolase [Oscillospiraceae bacterium]